MSTSPEPEFDLEKLFLPAWAQESPSVNRYAKYSGGGGAEGRPGDRGGERRERHRNFGPPGGPGGRRRDDRPREGGPRSSDRFSRGRGNDSRPRGRPEEAREPLQPLPEINVTLMPDERGVDSLAHQIKMTGRAYPLFDIAQMILQKPERQQVRFDVMKKEDGAVAQPLFLCALDDSIWLSEEEAIAHVLEAHFSTFYQTEKIPTEAPKGTYTFVAQCGMSGVILGPPNYHDYQNQLRRLHAERFSRMPFESFKSRVKFVKDEAVVKKWLEDQSFKTEYICLNVPEAKKLANREEVEKHFREVHLPELIKKVESHLLSGPASRQLKSFPLQRLLRRAWEEQKRFPLKVVNVLSHQFAQRGLQFFKVNKTITHVCVARPHYLDLEATPVSDGVKRIVEFINANPKTTRRRLMEALAPGETAPAPEEAKAQEGTTPPAPAAGTPQSAVAGDLHWLIHQGHVIEFASGILETAKKPAPKPPRQEAKPAAGEGKSPGEKRDVVPNASVEEIAPSVAELEAVRPVETAPAALPGTDAEAGPAPVPSDARDLSSDRESVPAEHAPEPAA